MHPRKGRPADGSGQTRDELMRLTQRLFVPIFLAAGPLAIGAGCGEGEPERKYRTIEGTAEEIKPPNRVSMSFVNDDGIERMVEGKVDPDSEIWINGRQAALEDIKPGDAVKVVGYAEGTGVGRSIVATKIEVETATFDKPDAPTDKGDASGATGGEGPGGDS